MSETDLEAVRRRFILEVAELFEDVWLGPFECARMTLVERFDVDEGTLVMRAGTGAADGPVHVEIPLLHLGRAWGALALQGREVLALDQDIEAVIEWLHLMLMEATQGVSSEDATDLVLWPSGTFEPRHSACTR